MCLLRLAGTSYANDRCIQEGKIIVGGKKMKKPQQLVVIYQKANEPLHLSLYAFRSFSISVYDHKKFYWCVKDCPNEVQSFLFHVLSVVEKII